MVDALRSLQSVFGVSRYGLLAESFIALLAWSPKPWHWTQTDVVTDVGVSENPCNQASSGFSTVMQFNMLLNCRLVRTNMPWLTPIKKPELGADRAWLIS